MKTDFKHNLKVEERIFHLDVAALCGYDEGFKAAYENGENYELGIKLNQLFLICPRKRQRKQQYERLVRFLALKHITLRITSRKHEKEKVINNQVKYQSSVNQNNIGERFIGLQQTVPIFLLNSCLSPTTSPYLVLKPRTGWN